MGSCMSRKLQSASSSSSMIISSSSSKSRTASTSSVKVVHLSGWTEEFEEAITVGEVTGEGKQQQQQEGIAKHFVFKNLSVDSKPLDSTAKLEVGNIYFMLPHSFFQTSVEMSHLDLATLSKRLTLVAAAPPKNNIHKKKKKQQQKIKLKRNRYADRYVNKAAKWDARTDQQGALVQQRIITHNDNHHNQKQQQQQQQQQQFSHLSQSCTWKPILESITETSFTLTPT